MEALVWHNCKPDESALVISVGSEPATPEQLNRITVILNFDEEVRELLARKLASREGV